MGETLQEKIAKLNSKNKRRIGYTAGAYGGVLNALQQSKGTTQNTTQQNPISGEAPTQTVISRSYSFLATHSTGQDVVEDGFFKNDELKQMQVQFNCFMGYPVSITTTDGKNANEYVENIVKINEDKGFTQISGRVYPPGDTSEAKNQTDNTNNYCIGLGVSLSIAVVDYFQHFYNKMKVFADSNSCQDVIKKLTSSGLLYCEVMIPIATAADVNGKYENKVIHFKVIADAPNTSTTSSYKVYIPAPVLLLNSYKEIGNISIEVCENFTTTNDYVVNSDAAASFFYKDKSFNHKEAIIEGFTCEDVKKHYFTENDIAVKHIGWQLSKNIPFARARFYLENGNELSSILNEDIPSEYQESLFRGVLTEDKVYRTDTVIVDMSTIGASYGEELNNFAAAVGLSVESLLTALKAISYWERGKKEIDAAWDDFEDTTKKDGCGYNIGPFSLTEVSGGLYKCLGAFAQKISQYRTQLQTLMSKIPSTNRTASKSYSSPITANDVNLIKEIYKNYPDEYKAAYINTIRNELWGKNAVTAYKNCGFNSTLGFASTLAHSIWRPSLVVKNFNNASISGESDQVVKVELSGAAFIIQGLKDKGYGDIPSARQVIDSVKNSKPDAKKWQSFFKAKSVGGWYTRASKLILYANNNLDIPNMNVFKY